MKILAENKRTISLFVLLAAMFTFFAVFIEYFYDLRNILTMSKYGVEIGFIALGEMLVIMSGSAGIDLSVGGVVNLTGIFLGAMLKWWGLPIALAIPLALALGAFLGLINGLLAVKLRFPPIIATLGTMYAYNSLALVLTNTKPISGFAREFRYLGNGTVLGAPFQFFCLFVPLFIVAHFVLNHTTLGRDLIATGTNNRAAWLCGIPVDRVRIWAYVGSGVLSALAAVIMTSRVASARPDAGLGYELQAITVAVLAGADMNGGKGSVGGVFISVCIIAMLSIALIMGGIPTDWRGGILGLILIVTVLANRFMERTGD